MSEPYIEQGAMNVVGWTLVVVGTIGAVASIIGCLLVWWTLAHYGTAPASPEYEGQFYVLRPTRQALWLFITSAVLSVAIACGGYVRTDRFVARTLRQLHHAK